MFNRDYLHSIFAPFASPPQKRQPVTAPTRLWECTGAVVGAHTKSEARAAFKRAFGCQGRLQAIVMAV